MLQHNGVRTNVPRPREPLARLEVGVKAHTR